MRIVPKIATLASDVLNAFIPDIEMPNKTEKRVNNTNFKIPFMFTKAKRAIIIS